MRRVVFSTALSITAALLAGIALQGTMATVLWFAIAFGVIVNVCFFFIRRWDGCIEKLGGATFTVFILLAGVVPLLWLQAYELVKILSVQLIVIGILTTHFLRTKNFNPPKPGEPFKW